MKKSIIKLIAIILLPTLFFACKKENVEMPTFDAGISTPNYRVGDTINYTFTGYADNISLYTGENVVQTATIVPSTPLLGYRYQYKDRDYADGNAFIQFSSVLQSVSQPNTLSLLISSNFSGVYDSAGIRNANWVDLTGGANLSNGSVTTPINSGLVSIPDSFKSKTVFIAFRYNATSGSQQPRWTITNLSVPFYAKGNDTASATKDTLTVANLNPSWRTFNIAGSQTWSSSTSQLAFTGGAGTTSVANEDWAISRDIVLNRVPVDKPAFIIKTLTDAMPATFRQPPYKKPGMYKVSFAANNANRTNLVSSVKEFTINVAP